MANKKELELERQALLMDIAGKVDFIYQVLSQATIQKEVAKEEKSERKTRKKAAKAE